MSTRATSLQATNVLAINREIDSKYDAVLAVRDKLVEIEKVAGLDVEQLLTDLQNAQDFTGINVVAGEIAGWNATTKTITVPTLKGDQGIQGPVGATGGIGATGAKGDRGLTGAAGTNGKDGKDGTNGTDGINGRDGIDGKDLTIEQISYNSGTGRFVWQFSDGTSYETPDLRGAKGTTGDKGDKGDQGTGVHHIKGTSTTNSQGTFGQLNAIDTYTVYGDAAETLNLGTFTVRNGVNMLNDVEWNKISSKPTTLSGYGITDADTSAQVTSKISTAIASLVDTAPTTLDTLNELAAALGDDPNFATTVTNSIASKVAKNADIVGGTGTKIIYDAKGLVTGSTSLAAGDIPSLDASKITTGTLPVNRGGTGTTTSTGTGNVVFSSSPTLVTPNIGVATGTSFNSITGLSSITPAAAGTAAVGVGTAAARADHVHPAQTTITGNAGTATALATGRTISLTGDVTYTSGSFDGSANVTGTATLATVTDSGTGSFKKITVDTKGRVTGTAAVAQFDITGLLGAGSITNTMLANSAVANLSGTNTGDETLSTIKTKLGITTLSGSNTGDQTITLTGDVTGTGTGSFATTLANTTVVAGTYGSASLIPTITVDSKGRLTGVSTNSISVPSGSITVTGGDLTMSGTTGTAITNATLSNVGTAGTYTKVTTDSKGRVTSGTTLSASDIPTLNQNTTGSAGSVVNSEIIKFDTGTTEGIDLYTFNGSTAKTIDIKAGTNVTLTKSAGSVTINASGDGGTASVSIDEYEFIATAGQTEFIFNHIGHLDVYMNGIKLSPSDYSTIDPTKITLFVGAPLGSLINIKVYSPFPTSLVYSKVEIDSMIGNINTALDTINGQVI